MAEPRVTKIACDCPNEADIVAIVAGTCPFCRDTGWMPVDVALRRASADYVFCFGDFVEGGTLKEFRSREAACERVYALAGVTPPWKEPSDA